MLSWPNFEVFARGWSIPFPEQLIEFTPQSPPLSSSHTPGHYTWILIASVPGTRPQVTTPRLQSPAIIIHVSQSWAFLPCPTFPFSKKKDICSQSPSLCLMTEPWYFSEWRCAISSQGTGSIRTITATNRNYKTPCSHFLRWSVPSLIRSYSG